MWRAVTLASLPSLLLAAALLVPLGGKAFTIDDTLFLRQAEHALVDPLHPAAFDIVWAESPERLSTIMPSGPVMAWLLAPVVAHGASERVAHGVVLATLLVGLVATVAIALRLGLGARGAALVGLLTASAPALAGMAGTAMPDVPAFALGALGLERLLAWRTDRRSHQGVAAAIALGLAAATRSHAGLLAGVGGLALAGDTLVAPRRLLASLRAFPRSPARALPAAPLVGAVALFLVVARLARDPERHVGPMGAALGFLGTTYLDHNLIGLLVSLALATPLVVGRALARGARLRFGALWQGVPLGVVLLASANELEWWWLVPVIALVVVVAVDLVADAVARRDATDLWLAAWLLPALPVVVYVNFAAKYLAPSVPAAALLVVRALVRGRPRSATPIALGLAAASALLSVGVLRADAALAGLGRRAAAELIAPRVARGERVWFVGHWGFQWYAERAGARPMTVAPPWPEVGDVVVASEVADPRVLRRFSTSGLTRLSSLTDDTPGGRIMSRADCAGFYSTHSGYLPWSMGSGLIDRYDVWRVTSPLRLSTPTP